MNDLRWLHPAAVLLLTLMFFTAGASSETPSGQGNQLPEYQVDPFWPKPLPNNWLLGQVSGVAVDADDHVWVLHRPKTLTADEAALAQSRPTAECCIPAPPVLEFDAGGNLIQAWGGPGQGYDWPETEHGVFVDHKGHIWIGGSGPKDHQVLKFDRKGAFLLQIGKPGQTGGSNDRDKLGRPAEFVVDPAANELFVADGYLNRRIIVFDADSGEYKRHWGAYGRTPDDSPIPAYNPDAPPAAQFRNPVHSVRIASDGLVYVCDRVNCRIQTFQKDGKFIRESFIAPRTLGNGSCWSLDFSRDPGQSLIFVADGTNQKVWIVRRTDMKVVGSFGRSGRQAGQFHWVHSLAVDSSGSIYTGEVETGKRAQKFVLRGSRAARQ